jgi:hypothetical protein
VKQPKPCHAPGFAHFLHATRSVAVFAAASGARSRSRGAFDAHALHGVPNAQALQICHTAVEYQFWRALELLALTHASAPGGAAPARFLSLSASLLSAAACTQPALGAPRMPGGRLRRSAASA